MLYLDAQLWACTVMGLHSLRLHSYAGVLFRIHNAYNAQRNNMSKKSGHVSIKKTDDMVKKLNRAILTEVKGYEKRDKIKYIKTAKST